MPRAHCELTLHVRRRVQTFFLSGSRTPQCLSKSHSLSEDIETQSQLRHHNNPAPAPHPHSLEATLLYGLGDL